MTALQLCFYTKHSADVAMDMDEYQLLDHVSPDFFQAFFSPFHAADSAKHVCPINTAKA